MSSIRSGGLTCGTHRLTNGWRIWIPSKEMKVIGEIVSLCGCVCARGSTFHILEYDYIFSLFKQLSFFLNISLESKNATSLIQTFTAADLVYVFVNV